MFRFVHQLKSTSFLGDDDSDDNFVRMAARGIHDDEIKPFMTMNIPHEDDFERNFSLSGCRCSQSMDENLMKNLKKSYRPPLLTQADTSNLICTCVSKRDLERGVIKVCRCNRPQTEYISPVTSKPLIKSVSEESAQTRDLGVHGIAIPIKDTKRRTRSADNLRVRLNIRK